MRKSTKDLGTKVILKGTRKHKRMYGKELILDLHNCNTETFTRKELTRFFQELCLLIDMKPEKLVWWDDQNLPAENRQTEPHLVGITAVQFILTSNITIHTLPLLKAAYVNIFSCKDFDVIKVTRFTRIFFQAGATYPTVVNRL